MSVDQGNPNDPMAFVRNLWGGMGFNLPGMVTPTFDIEELDKRIKDMKAVEGWLRMNLSMLQMTIQGLEMQRTTVSTVKTMSQMASDAIKTANPETAAPATEVPPAAFSEAAMWPWQMMQQMREKIEQQAAAASEATAETATEKATRRKK
jgi:CCR4-NOT transcriptional regulation complex NOT5 subunit